MLDMSEQSVKKTRNYDYTLATFDEEAAMVMTGLEYMQAVVSGEIGAMPSMAQTMNFSISTELSKGKAVIDTQAEDYMFNPMGTIHGGYAATILDSALGISVYTALPKATVFTTAELKINYVRALLPSSGKLRAEAKVIHVGRQMATAEGRLIGVEDGKLYAHGSTTCFISPLKPKK